MNALTTNGECRQYRVKDCTEGGEPWARFGRSGQSQPGGIRVVDFATAQESMITGSENLFSPRWSPEGQYIAALTHRLHQTRPLQLEDADLVRLDH